MSRKKNILTYLMEIMKGWYGETENGFTYKKYLLKKPPEGQEPVPQPIRDAQGNIDESKLSSKMPENNDTEEPADSIPKVTPGKVSEKNPKKK